MQQTQKDILSNGVRVVSENHPASLAVAIGVFVARGSRDEDSEQAGITHFLEHLVFKGTKNRTSFQISQSLEALGGELNAFTTREYTCFHATVLRDHWLVAVDVLCDLVANMRVSIDDFKREKGVVLQEIAMSFDNHEDIIYDHLFDAVYPNHGLGRSILGSVETLTNLTYGEVREYYQDHYAGNDIIVACCGHVSHAELVFEIEKRLGKKKSHAVPKLRNKPRWKKARKTYERTAEQVHLLLGVPSIGFHHPQRFEAYLFNTILGGGMTSRLYQAVREKLGLVYAIHSLFHSHCDSGLMMIYASSEPVHTKKVASVVLRELEKISTKPIPSAQLDSAKTQIIGSILLGSDDMENRMSSLGVNELIFGKYKPISDVIEAIQAVDSHSLQDFIAKEFDLNKMSGILLGENLEKMTGWFEKLGQ
ncbi:MAG TPA: pitrilysin family protein [Pseudobdellovibrionaceae bacterium]|nr:pitrilysin family protein [Pseudobdellovibrionaceae bacterium]